jgi:hypothetical protein
MGMHDLSNARHRARLSGLMAGLLVAGSLVSGLPAAAQDTQGKPLIDLIRVENGTKDALDGGDFTAVIVGNQAFGVIYGSAERPAPVTLFTVMVRSLGTATVNDAETGRVVARDVTLPFMTLVAERLDALFEFRDVNGDGIFNFRPNLETRDPFDFGGAEPAVKGASLWGDWNLTGFELAAVSGEQVDLTMVLTLNGTGYRSLLDAGKAGNDRVDRVEFTLRVAITRQRVEGASIPHFHATVERRGGQRALASIEPDGTAVRSYTTTRAVFKVDHDIVGWDFAPPRVDVESRLMLHATILYANAIDKRIAPWLTDAALGGDRGGAANVTSEHNETTVTPDRQLSEFRPASAVGLRDGFGRAGSVAWVPTASVWEKEASPEPYEAGVQFQVLGGARYNATVDGRAFRGFVLSAGFVYPAGYRIYHDPELQAESVEVEGNSFLPSLLPALALLGEAVLVVGALAGLLALVVRATSGSAKARAADEARRLQALRERYALPPKGDSPGRGGA